MEWGLLTFVRIMRGAFILYTSVAATVQARSFQQNNLNLIGKSFGIPGNATYDYIIVGGGTAGNTVATRLAQRDSCSVAVVEAGGFYEINNGNLSVVPSTAAYFAGADPDDVNPSVDWGIVTTPQAVSV